MVARRDRRGEEEADLHAIPGNAAPYVVPVRARAFSRAGERLTIEWVSGADPVADMTVSVTESLVIGVFEHRPPLTGPNATGEALVRTHRQAVVDVGDAPLGLRVLDRYSGDYLPEQP